MSGRSFRSVFMVASCAGAALGCYLVSLRVASERAAVESVESRIVLTQRDIRMLQTEIGTRGRLAQLERWNVKALALSAPSADQFLSGSFELARLVRPQHQVDFQASVVLATAPAPERKPAPIGQESVDEAGGVASAVPTKLLHEASLKTETREAPASAVAVPQRAANTSASRPVAAVRPANKMPVDKPDLAAAKPKKSVDKLALGTSKPVTKPVRLATTDPLAPLGARPTSKAAKDSGSPQ
jgi:hypothetical protein